MLSSSSYCFTVTVLAALILMAESHQSSYINYTTITGFFLQDDLSTNASTFDYVNVLQPPHGTQLTEW